MAASMMVEAANGPTTAEGAAVLASRNIPVVPDVLANAGGVVASYFEWAQDLQGFMWERDLFQRRLEKTMHDAFDCGLGAPPSARRDASRHRAGRRRGAHRRGDPAARSLPLITPNQSEGEFVVDDDKEISELRALVRSLRDEVARLRAEINRLRRDRDERPPHHL